jgi:hypothetical protein
LRRLFTAVEAAKDAAKKKSDLMGETPAKAKGFESHGCLHALRSRYLSATYTPVRTGCFNREIVHKLEQS